MKFAALLGALGLGLIIGGTPVLASSMATASPSGVAPSSSVVETPHQLIGNEKVGPAVGEDVDGNALESAPLTEREAWALENTDPLANAAAQIETDYPQDYAHAYFGGDDRATLFIGFSKTAPADAVQLLAATGKPFRLEEGLGYGQAAYRAASNDVAARLADGEDKSVRFMVSNTPDVKPGLISVIVSADDPEAAQRVVAAARALSVGEPFTVAVNVGDVEYTPTSYNRAGGTWLIDSGGGKASARPHSSPSPRPTRTLDS